MQYGVLKMVSNKTHMVAHHGAKTMNANHMDATVSAVPLNNWSSPTDHRG